MSLITRCPSCATQFRVVADQLRISEGWVRCGRCQEVFDATQALQEGMQPTALAPVTAPQDAPSESQAFGSKTHAPSPAPESEWVWPDVPEPAIHPADIPAQDVAPAVAHTRAVDAAHLGYELPSPIQAEADTFAAGPLEEAQQTPAAQAATSADAWLDAPLRESPGMQVPPAAHGSADQAALADAAPATATATAWESVKALAAEDAQALQWSQAWLAVKTTPVAGSALAPDEGGAAERSVLPKGAVDAQPLEEVLPEDTVVPSFVKQAQRKAWWSKPLVRFVMGMLVTLLPLALLLQIAIHERNHLVAWKPQWQPMFQAMCVALRCELAPRQHITSVVLTGSSFNQDAQPNHYRLGLSIQNQSAASVATPAVELTLTDTQGQTLVRKVLLPDEIGAPAQLAANSEWNGSLPVATQGLQLPVSGYRVLAFYP